MYVCFQVSRNIGTYISWPKYQQKGCPQNPPAIKRCALRRNHEIRFVRPVFLCMRALHHKGGHLHYNCYEDSVLQKLSTYPWAPGTLSSEYAAEYLPKKAPGLRSTPCQPQKSQTGPSAPCEGVTTQRADYQVWSFAGTNY